MNYQESLDYLFSLIRSGIKLGLENTAHLLRHFGDPQLAVSTIHIAGTNGKGSTAAFTESILRASGHRVGLYTSPHLVDFRERIQVNRVPIAEDEFASLVGRVKQAADSKNIPVTFFEFGTVLAFLYFSEKKLDWNVIEVGLGGRLDATNFCQAPISILTSISKDHENYLGHDLEKITFEKASIIKEGGTVFADIPNEVVSKVISRVAQERHATLKRLRKDFNAERASFNSQTQLIHFRGQQREWRNLKLPLIGQHQVSNAALAVAACLQLNSEQISISEEHVRQGLQSTIWSGRLETVAQDPTIVLDCAHNPDGVKSLTTSLKEYFQFEQCLLVVGMMKDKSVEEMLDLFVQFAQKIILVKPRQARSEDPNRLYTLLSKNNKFVEIINELPYA
ncbi:MAG: folylpolyglutamate synthase/dihydrofolate synthase family protein, partial [Nitrospinota bacterium]|nr:folylpolyglutamate synthase/dihydrofolate synthase family protein [Nitrospinota bacterium]